MNTAAIKNRIHAKAKGGNTISNSLDKATYAPTNIIDSANAP